MEFKIKRLPVVTIREVDVIRINPLASSNETTDICYELIEVGSDGRNVIERGVRTVPNMAMAALYAGDRDTINYFLGQNSPAHSVDAMEIPVMELEDEIINS